MALRRSPDWPEPRYDSRISNIATEFFIPALRESTTYRRLAGFFSSTSLSLAARGVKELIDNEGRMQIVASPILTREDAEVLGGSGRDMDEALDGLLSGRLDMETEFERSHVAALAYLLKKGFLEIRLDVPRGTDGRPLDYDSVIQKSLLDEKLGIFQDREGNAMSFRGPVNENRQSWERGTYEITVDCGWVEGQRVHVEGDAERFQKKWDDAALLALPARTRDRLVGLAPDDPSEIGLERFNVPEWAVLPSGRVLWDHQIRAVNSWVNLGRRGILSMATSGGKTLSALVSASLSPAGSIIVVLVHTGVLVDQWEGEIRGFDPGADLIPCDSGHPGWEPVLSGRLGAYVGGDPGRDRHLWVLATMQTAAGDKFLSNFERIRPELITLVCDEVHHLGAPAYSRALGLDAGRRLGLSATFVREWDEAGTGKIREYFGRQLDVSYTVSDGIRDKALSRYEYRPFFALMAQEEYDEYSAMSASIRRIYAQMKATRDKAARAELEKRYSKMLMDRAEILKKAEDKPRAYGQVIASAPEKPYIVFADDHEQVGRLKGAHKEAIRRINSERSEGLERDDIMTFSGRLGPDERRKVLEEARGNQTPMFAMYCLDEGVDVPEFRSAILASSSTSKRQYIQRRGRILRSSGKDKAYLYDIIVLPNPHSYEVDPRDAESIIGHERERVRELAGDAINKWEAIGALDAKLRDLGLAGNKT